MATKKSTVPNIVLTSPTKKKKGKDKLEVEGFEQLVVDMRQRNQEMESLKAEQALDNNNLTERVKELRIEAEKSGTVYTVALVHSADDVPAKVVFKNQFRPIDESHRPELKRHLGKTYDALFDEVEVATLRDDKLQELEKLLGNRFDEFFDKSTHIKPKKDYMERRGELRKTLSTKVNALLDMLIEQVQYKPQLTLK